MNKSSNFLLIVSLGFLNALTPFTIDLYLPAFADIALDLNSSVARVSLSVSTYFVGFALGQIIYGPLLDRFGRKPPILFGLILYTLATVGCMMATTVEELLLFRFLTALGGSGASVGTLTMVRDYFERDRVAKVFSMLMLVLSVSPLFAPTIGGWVAAQFGWRTIFGSLIGVALIDIALVIFVLPYRYKPNPEMSLSPQKVLLGFIDIFKVQQFRVYALAGAFSFAGLFIYLTGSPGIYIDGYGFTKNQYSLVFALLATGMIGGGQLNNFLMKHFSSATIFRAMVFTQTAIGMVFSLSLIFFQLDAVVATTFLFFLISSVGIAYPNAAALSIQSFSKNIGSASSLLGFTQMGVGALLASLIGVLNMKGALSTALVITVSAVCASAIIGMTRTESTGTAADVPAE